MKLNFKSEYLCFYLIKTLKKTRVFCVCSKTSSATLGVIKWFGPWRQYCFFPEPDCIFSKGCLNDINNFIEFVRPSK